MLNGFSYDSKTIGPAFPIVMSEWDQSQDSCFGNSELYVLTLSGRERCVPVFFYILFPPGSIFLSKIVHFFFRPLRGRIFDRFWLISRQFFLFSSILARRRRKKSVFFESKTNFPLIFIIFLNDFSSHSLVDFSKNQP